MLKKLMLMLLALTIIVVAQTSDVTKYRGVSIGDDISDLVKEMNTPYQKELLTKDYYTYTWTNVFVSDVTEKASLIAHVVKDDIAYMRLVVMCSIFDKNSAYNAWVSLSADYMLMFGLNADTEVETGHWFNQSYEKDDYRAVVVRDKEYITYIFDKKTNSRQQNGEYIKITPAKKSMLLIEYINEPLRDNLQLKLQ